MQGFKEKVQSMTGKEILQAMIDGLEKEWVSVDMDTFGRVSSYLLFMNKCFGCAATNAICQINDKAFTADNIKKRYLYDKVFVQRFENAIDYLRRGNVDDYNKFAEGDFAKLPTTSIFLPILTTLSFRERLHYYQKYCDSI